MCKGLEAGNNFPSEEASEGLGLALEATQLWASLCLKVCSQLPLRPWARPFTESWEGLLCLGCQLEDSAMVGEIDPLGAVPP